MDYKCLIDNSIHATIYDLHRHLRGLKTKQADYYQKYFPRKDLLTGEPIIFKDWESYLKTDFCHKNNLKRFCAKDPVAGLEWSKKYFQQRIKEKNLINAPHHVELRSLFCPNVNFFEENGGYANFCTSVGLNMRFNYKLEPVFTKLPDNYHIILDNREQKPLPIKNAVAGTLSFGDYALDDKNNQGVYIERKSLSDFVGSVGRDFERFSREIERAKVANAYLVVLVESDFNSASSFNYLPHMRFTKETPDHIFHNMRLLLHNFDNLQFLFVDGRKEAVKILIKLFEMGQRVKKIDLLWSYEKGKF